MYLVQCSSHGPFQFDPERYQPSSNRQKNREDGAGSTFPIGGSYAPRITFHDSGNNVKPKPRAAEPAWLGLNIGAKNARENFRENARTVIGDDDGQTFRATLRFNVNTSRPMHDLRRV